MKKNFLILCSCALVCFYSGHVAAQQAGFNPDISLTLDGRYGHYSNTTDYELPGFMLGGEASRGEQGFSLVQTELSLSGNIDGMFFCKLTTALADHEVSPDVVLE